MTSDTPPEIGAGQAGVDSLIQGFRKRCDDVTARLIQHDEHTVSYEIHCSCAWACRVIASQVRQWPWLQRYIQPRLEQALTGFDVT
jgi:hypothetical protein